MRKVRMFYENDFGDFCRQKLETINTEVSRESDDYFSGVNIQEYSQHMADKYLVNPLIAHFDQMDMTDEERMIPFEELGGHGFIIGDPDKSYQRTVLTIHIPYEGDAILWSMHPNPAILITKELTVAPEEVSFEVLVRSNDQVQVQTQIDEVVGWIKTQLGHLNANIESYNRQVPDTIANAISQRQAALASKQGLVKSLSIPLRKKENLPDTYRQPVISTVKKISVVPKPAAKSREAEFSISDDMYREILKVLHDTGVMLETHPSLYVGKDEEAIRDLLLSHLQPRFELSATAEAFNKQGKTDILLKHQDKNVFIAECKFWKGKEEFLKTISQLLGYLTWRDSKAAVVIFVKNKDISSVLGQVPTVAVEHDNYTSTQQPGGKSWFNFTLHLDGDTGTTIKVAVLVFHLPETSL